MKFLDRADAFAKRIERFVSGKTPTDPLYVTNRSVGNKLRLGFLIGGPVLITAGFLFLALNNYFDPPPDTGRVTAAEAKKKPTGDVTAKVLPNVDKDFTPSNDYSREIEVLEATVGRLDHVLTGKLRNNTDHVVRVADVVFDVTDDDGSQIGGVSLRLENVAPKTVTPFRLTLPQTTARSALVREVHSR